MKLEFCEETAFGVNFVVDDFEMLRNAGEAQKISVFERSK